MCLNLGMQTAPLQSVDLITCLKVSMSTNFCRVMTQFCIAPVHKRPTSLTLQAKILLSLRAARCVAHPSESWCVHTPTQLLRRLLVWTGQTVGVCEWKRSFTNLHISAAWTSRVQGSNPQTVHPLPTQKVLHSPNVPSNPYLVSQSWRKWGAWWLHRSRWGWAAA